MTHTVNINVVGNYWANIISSAVIRKIKITVNRHFDVSNIILKIEVVYANAKVIMRELKILNM